MGVSGKSWKRSQRALHQVGRDHESSDRPRRSSRPLVTFVTNDRSPVALPPRRLIVRTPLPVDRPHEAALPPPRMFLPHRVPLALMLLLTWSVLPAAAEFGPPRALAVLHEPGSAAIKGDVRSVTRLADGTLLVGSNLLAAFDGTNWQPIEIPGAYGFRALAPAGPTAPHRAWVGAIGTVGYAEKDPQSRWHYTSLLPALAAAGLPAVSDVWSVRPLGDGAVWVTNEHAFRWTPPTAERPGHFDVWHLPAKSRLSAFGGGDTVWIHQEDIGLLRVERDRPPTLALPEASLPQRPVTWLISPTRQPATLLLGLKDAAYRWTESTGFTRLDFSDSLEGSLATDAAELPGNRIAVATFDNGIVFASFDGAPLGHTSTDQGLADNSIYSVFADADRLWAASPLGLSRLDGAGRVDFFERQSALDGGRPLEALSHEGQTYLLTTRHLLRASTRDTASSHELQPVLSAAGVFADLLPSPDGLWVGGFGGVWRLAGSNVRQEYFASSDILRLCRTQRVPRGVLFLDGYRLKLLVPSARGDWVTRDLAASVSDSPVSLFEDPSGDVWVSTMTQGVARFKWADSTPAHAPRLQLVRAYRGGLGFPAQAGRTELIPWGDRLFAFTETGILSLRADQLGFEPAPEFAPFVGIATTPFSPDAPAHWLVRSRALAHTSIFSVLRVEPRPDGSLATSPVEVPGLDSLGPPTSIARIDDFLWIGSTRGWLHVDARPLRSPPAPPPPPLRATRFENGAASFAFHYALPAAAGGDVLLYQTRLHGADSEWSPPSPETSRTFENLAPQNYRFEVRALDRFGRNGPIASHPFSVLAPWWKSAPAFAAYAILLAAAVAAAARWQVARLRRQNEQLNRLVAERTREIELASTAKSEFLDNVSHEIRNPLNGLTGLLAMLNEDRLDPRERELARSLKSVASTLTQVFEDVLQFSKLEYGYGRLERRPFALRPLLDDVLALFAAQAHQAGCVLRIAWPAGFADGFEGDPDKIKTIVVNFVGNALKYAPRAPIEIRVEATGEADGLVDLYLDVIDHGPGVPPEEQELIFKKFVRGKRARDSKVAGTGLGLATCSMLAKMMNGSVGVDSTPGRGSTFSLKLLLPRAPLAESAKRPPETPPPEALAGPLLIVDDEPYNRTVLEGIARELGSVADSAATAEEALQRLAGRDYTVVFLDWELPDGKGGDVARALRTRATSPRPIILATTAHDSDEMRQRCRDAGMDGFLLKPYDAARVRHAIALAASPSTPTAAPSTHATSQPANGTENDLDHGAFELFSRTQPCEPATARARYVEAIDEHARIIANAVATGDTATVSREAHRLRALSGLVRATALNRAAAHLEDIARRGAGPACAAAWTTTHRACEELKIRLRT